MALCPHAPLLFDTIRLHSALRAALRYSELEGPTFLGKGNLLDDFPLESAAVSSEPTQGEASANIGLKLTEAEASAKRDEIVASFAAKLGVDASRIVLDIKPSATSLIQTQVPRTHVFSRDVMIGYDRLLA